MEWAKDQYNKQYDVWVPWLEDFYLRYFTRDNKASYTTRENLSKTKATNISQIDTLQDNANNLVADQLGQDGLVAPVGDLASREGVNRVERKGKDEKGGYIPSSQVGGPAGGVGEAVAGGGNAVVGGVVEGARQGAGAVGGFVWGEEGLR
ncbi:hypothetical protein C8A01DRAFT_38031 [Parachaetomium inaequale]|uniref:Uncharacterized protein n=1 Tax=Parachaetomium inaequale TaxID=2588326 RepID=A0AAN6PDR4_9PEZI|nr:hypothetical protein C8A01DRAFT_38031 [Parachaetomium inaequale]